MTPIPVEQFLEHPDRLLTEAQNGEVALVTQDGEPVFLAVPMGASLDASKARLEIAVSLFDREQISLGVAARIAGLAISEMIDELGRRRIPVIRYSKEELAQELEQFRDPSVAVSESLIALARRDLMCVTDLNRRLIPSTSVFPAPLRPILQQQDIDGSSR